MRRDRWRELTGQFLRGTGSGSHLCLAGDRWHRPLRMIDVRHPPAETDQFRPDSPLGRMRLFGNTHRWSPVAEFLLIDRTLHNAELFQGRQLPQAVKSSQSYAMQHNDSFQFRIP
jgi:hypothetical protein